MNKKSLKNNIRNVIMRNSRSRRLFLLYKSYGVKGVSLEIIFYLALKLGFFDDRKEIKKQAMFVYEKSRHLNLMERFLKEKKNTQTAVLESTEKKQLKKRLLPIIEI